MQLEQDLRVSAVERKSNLTLAAGSDLEVLAGSLEIQRVAGAPARGTVLGVVRPNAAQSNVVVEPGAVLTNTSTGLQYIVNTNAPLTLTVLGLVPFSVVAAESGAEYNLAPGIRLSLTDSAGTQASADFYVGYERKSDGTYCGSIDFGSDPETDESLRIRLIERYRGHAANTPNEIKSRLLQASIVNRAWVRTVGCGLAEVLIESDQPLTTSQSETLKNQIAPFMPVGTLVTLGNVETKKIDMAIEVVAFNETSLQDLDARLKTTLNLYLQDLEIGETFFPNDLTGLLRPFARSVKVIAPEKAVSTSSYQVIQLNNLSIKYVNPAA
ncbi:baseplate J/gp47 family protein [Leptolyngbya sp. AN03gr2]|uniref:baseplate J/gp47 family protein n=1 Tax=Leptolyngbya sp. AN03gr2 TaxID=3423364 RepID=UPI003D31A281